MVTLSRIINSPAFFSYGIVVTILKNAYGSLINTVLSFSTRPLFSKQAYVKTEVTHNTKTPMLLSLDEVKARLGVDEETLNRMNTERFLVPYTHNGEAFGYDETDIHRFIFSSYNTRPNTITILIPCHNEEKGIRACIDSCLLQTRKADQILVIDDGSTDSSPEILKTYGDTIQVLTLPRATGNKSFAQEKGLEHVSSDVFFATDGDTILDTNVLYEIEKSFKEDPRTVAVGGYVKSLPYNWLTACRELDYIVGQNLHKVAQAHTDALFVVPGCAGAFKTKVFKDFIHFDHDTLTEDLDFTYKLHKNFFKIAYNKNAIAYTQDPATLREYINQVRRWYCGGWQNLRKHYGIAGKPNNALQLSLTYVEGLVFSIVLFVLPIINIKFFVLLVPYMFFLVALGLYGAIIRKRIDLLVCSPLYMSFVFINAYVFLEQFVKEIVLSKNNLVWFHPERRSN